METYKDLKIQKSLRDEKKTNFKKYAELVIGSESVWDLMKYEFVITFTSWIPGAIGLFLRSKFYPSIIGKVGKNVIFGRNITLRHPKKIWIGNNVMIDDNTMLDAKGFSNKGIILENGVFVGRNCILYCKNGDIHLKENVNIGHNCTIFSSNKVLIHENTLMAAYCYVMSGGSYDYHHAEVVFAGQEGYSKGPTVIGEGCWLGAKVVVLDGVSIGNRTVVGAGAVVTKSLPSHVVAVGVPAKVAEVVAKPD